MAAIFSINNKLNNVDQQIGNTEANYGLILSLTNFDDFLSYKRRNNFVRYDIK